MGRVWHELQRSRTRVSAESFQQKRKRRTFVLASTEPHSCECGEIISRLTIRSNLKKLQRSRTRVSAERTPAGRWPASRENRFNGAALV